MDYVEDLGVDDQFVRNLTQYASHYEHHQYMDLLKRMKTFVNN